jgi:uncharacterized membrane protein SirB2
MDYFAVKTVHQTAVALSLAGFFSRGLGAKTVPHVVDSVLLLSALWLAWTLRLTPTAAPWLLAKIIGLVVYIGLGMVALKPGRPAPARAAAWIAALATFGWIVSVAITKNPLGAFSLLRP